MESAIESVVGPQVIFKKVAEDEGVHNNFRIPLKSCPLLRVRGLYSLLLLFNVRMTLQCL